MKKLVLISLLFVVATVATQAQFLGKPSGDVGAPSAGAPVAEGFFVVSAAAGAYAYLRKKKED